MGAGLFPPKFDCPHAAAIDAQKILNTLLPKKIDDPDTLFAQPCCSCEDNSTPKKPWLCITCGEVHCLGEDHMDAHCTEKSHPISLNIADKMFWCVECKSYVVHSSLLEVKRRLYKGPPAFTRQELVEGLKEKRFQRIAVLTGAGISVAAGIPDFRTPGTGLYSRLSDLGLPFAEAVFQLDFYRSNPFPFYEVARSFLVAPSELEDADQAPSSSASSLSQSKPHIQPVYAHHFIKELDDRNQLLLNFTQNIDGLELLAGLSEDKLIQAHGHMRTAHCIDCQKEYTMKDFIGHLKRQRKPEHRQDVFLCKTCVPEGYVPKASNHPEGQAGNTRVPLHNDESEKQQVDKKDKALTEYKGLVKPDIVFFGENLPESFKVHKDDMEKADLVIVMGTSLQVFPFASLISIAPNDIPVVMINRENPGVDRDRFLFLSGDIQLVLQELMDEVNGKKSVKELEKAKKLVPSPTSAFTTAKSKIGAKGKASMKGITNALSNVSLNDSTLAAGAKQVAVKVSNR